VVWLLVNWQYVFIGLRNRAQYPSVWSNSMTEFGLPRAHVHMYIRTSISTSILFEDCRARIFWSWSLVLFFSLQTIHWRDTLIVHHKVTALAWAMLRHEIFNSMDCLKISPTSPCGPRESLRATRYKDNFVMPNRAHPTTRTRLHTMLSGSTAWLVYFWAERATWLVRKRASSSSVRSNELSWID
jgi:hypothetical protein